MPNLIIITLLVKQYLLTLIIYTIERGPISFDFNLHKKGHTSDLEQPYYQFDSTKYCILFNAPGSIFSSAVADSSSARE